jgi:hypothetical protein
MLQQDSITAGQHHDTVALWCCRIDDADHGPGCITERKEPAMGKRRSAIGTRDLQRRDRAAEPVEVPSPRRKPRADIVHTSVYVPRPAYRLLREIAFTEECKIHDLLIEGVSAVLTKRGHPTVAELKERPAT